MGGRLPTALFLEFRTIPVLLWSYTAVSLGTAIAAFQFGVFDPIVFLLSMAVATLIQGFSTHAVNEVYDRRSGTDLHPSPRLLSGGSRVLTAGLLSPRGMWILFAITSGLIALVTAALVSLRGPAIAAFVAVGYLAGLAYTVPPVATSYRPFLGEWFGGFLGVFTGSIGAFFAQATTVTPLAVVAAGGHAFVCVGMLLVHHYLDREADATSHPPKRTTVVVLGFPAAKAYTLAVAAAAAAMFAVATAIGGPAFLVAVTASGAGILAHARIRPRDVGSTTRGELRVIQAGIAGGLGAAIVLTPIVWPVAPIAVAGYLLHLRIGAPFAAPASTPGPSSAGTPETPTTKATPGSGLSPP